MKSRTIDIILACIWTIFITICISIVFMLAKKVYAEKEVDVNENNYVKDDVYSKPFKITNSINSVKLINPSEDKRKEKVT